MDKLVQYVIYNNPTDFPGLCVARKWLIGCGTIEHSEVVATGKTVDEVRAKLPRNIASLPVYANDDPVIAEVWMET